MEDSPTLTYRYRFLRQGVLEKEFIIELEAATLTLQPPETANLPDWTRLDYEKCANCPLDSKDNPRCPAAAAMAEPIDYFKDRLSYEEYDIEVVTPERAYHKTTGLQFGASALMGLLMAVSGCPVMGQLKPMTRVHLPFSSMEETLYRVISMYLLAQLFEYRGGGQPDWDLKQLVKIYEDVEKVNSGFTKRLKAVHTQDAGLNAIIHLDCYRRFANINILETDLKQIARYFGR